MKLILPFFFLLFLGSSFGQTPSDVVEAQLKAYNSKDIGAFMTVFSKDVTLWNLGDSLPWAKGEEQVRSVYAKLFETSPKLNSEVISRTTIGNKVLDYERITGRKGGDVLFLIMVYEVSEGKIFRATAIRE
ncbi:nuclear transport factor 2 family protein [Crocinitomicaceae bacterium]|nr:nuclear transport factor 2 family protein [Crocinitomicaceae bacterium]